MASKPLSILSFRVGSIWKWKVFPDGRPDQLVRGVDQCDDRRDDEAGAGGVSRQMANHLDPVTHEADLPADHPNLTLWTALFDTHVSTFTWTVR